MKSEILDTPFHEKITDVLKKDEKILWSEQPRKKIRITLFDFIIISFSAILYLFYNNYSHIPTFPLLVGTAFMTMLLVIKIREFMEAKNTYYAISQERIFFQIKRNGVDKIFSIPFENIKKLVVINDAIHIKTINPLNPFLENKNQSEINPLPVIQNIDDVSKVIKIFKRIQRTT